MGDCNVPGQVGLFINEYDLCFACYRALLLACYSRDLIIYHSRS